MAKLDNKKLMVCCANGAGSSLMMKMTVQKVLKKYGIHEGDLHHCALSEGKSAARNYDVVFCARNFASTFDDAKKNGTVIIPLRNIMSAPEIEKGLKEAGLLD